MAHFSKHIISNVNSAVAKSNWDAIAMFTSKHNFDSGGGQLRGYTEI